MKGRPACSKQGVGGDLTGALHILGFHFLCITTTTTSTISCCIKILNGLPFWNQLNQVVLQYWLLNDDV